MLKVMNMNKQDLNTIYIISKGRPDCLTAATFEKMGYTGEWFILCGNNDETIPQYIERWGKDRVIIFDWYETVKECDFLDNFGTENYGSGCVPVRTANHQIATEQGKTRYWQFDDDYNGFYYLMPQKKKWHRLTGEEFEEEIFKLAKYAHTSKLSNIGFAVASDTRPEKYKDVGHRVFNAHNLPTDNNLFTKWRSRMNEDLINAIETYRQPKYELFVKYMNITMAPTQSMGGGNTEIYLQDGTVRKAAYAVMIDPKNVKLTIRHGRYHHICNWGRMIPKVVSGKHAKYE